MNRRTLIILVAALCGLSACGPKATLSPNLGSPPIQSVAVLPVEAPEEIREERVRFMEAAIAEELESRGYVLLEPSVVREYCSRANCEQYNQLAKRYPVKGFVKVRLSTVQRSNFILGYYNNIDGELVLVSPSGAELARVEHTESKRGGLVFDSGQVIQAVIEQYQNYGDWGYNQLASGFAERVVGELPAHSVRSSGASFQQPEIRSVLVTPRARMVNQICASGSPGQRADLIIGKRRTNLREVQSGRYCGVYRFPKGQVMDQRIEVELRTPFGQARREAVQLGGPARSARSGVALRRVAEQ